MTTNRPLAPRVKLVLNRADFVGGVGVQVRHLRAKMLLTAGEAIELANHLADAVEQIRAE